MQTSKYTTRATDELLDRIRMTDNERLAARTALAQGERIADLLLAATGLLKSAALGAERELRALTRPKSYN